MKHIENKVDIMTPHEVQLVHETSLKILSEIGMSVPNREVLKKCEDIGGIVDYEKQTVKIPVKVMEDLIEKIQAKSKRDDSVKNKLNGSISTQVFYFDYETKTRRYGVMDDIYKGIKLIDTLKNFWGTSAIVVPSDVPANISDVKAFHAVYSYAKKEGGTFILTKTGAKYIVEMSKAMGRGCGYFLETVSPLQYRKESLEIALEMSKMGCGISVGPMVIGGAIGPITIAGNCALQNAEILGSMFIGNALTGQLQFGYGCFNHSMDLKTMVCSFGSPNQALLGMAAGQMGRFYGLSSVSNSGLTDSLIPDFQAGFEKASSAVFSLLAGNCGIGGQGIVGADQGVSLEQLVIDNEWMDMYNYIMSGFEVNEDTLAYDVIKEVGIGGNYIAEEHTVRHIKDSYKASRLFNRDNYEIWNMNGKISTYDRAHEYVEDVTKGYKNMEPVVPPTTFEELNRILAEAEKELSLEREKE